MQTEKRSKKYIPPPRWKKGESGNPSGRPKLPDDIIEIRKKTSYEAERYLHEILAMPIENLVALSKDKSNPSLQLLLVSITLNAIRSGDEKKANFLMERAGMVVDRSPLVAMQINHNSIPQEQLDAIAPEKLATLLMDEMNAKTGLEVLPMEERGTVLEARPVTEDDPDADPQP